MSKIYSFLDGGLQPVCVAGLLAQASAIPGTEEDSVRWGEWQVLLTLSKWL